MTSKKHHSVFVSYHFFPHYRKAIIDRLAVDKNHEYVFAAEIPDPYKVVKEMDVSQLTANGQFIHTRCTKIGPLLWQPGLTYAALRSGTKTWIFLGFPHNVSVWAAAIVGRLTGKRVLFWVHGWVRREQGAKKLLRKTFLDLANGLLLYGHRAKEIAIEYGTKEGSLYVVYNSLDYQTQKSFRDRLSAEGRVAARAAIFGVPDLPLLVCPSRLTTQRGLPLAFKALAKMASEGRPCNLLLIGDGPERKQLEDLAQELKINVHFYGACYDESKLSELISMSDVTVAPGQIGLTAMHSLSYGVPVVTHGDADEQMPEFESIIDGWNGYLFKREDLNDLCMKIQDAIQLGSKEDIKERCYAPIDQFYNPDHQALIIDRAIRKVPADSSEWYAFVEEAKKEAEK